MRLIDVDALGIGKCNPEVFDNKGYADGWNAAISMIENAPIIDSKHVRYGKWVARKQKNEPEEAIDCCSRCRYPVSHFWRVGFKYCPNCGAKMDLND